MSIALACAVFLTSLPLAPAGEVKLEASAPGSEDYFGYDVACSGEVSVVGAPRGVNPTAPGFAGIFRGLDFASEQEVQASDGFTGDAFGFAVDVQGETLLVGAPATSGVAPASGAAYVFRERGGAWIEVARLAPSDGALFDAFGFSLALSGPRLAVGAPFADHSGLVDAGAVYIFEEVGGAWVESHKLSAPDAVSFDNFGWSVGLRGDRLACGAPGVDQMGGLSGSVYLREFDGQGWPTVAELFASDAAPLARFGNALALDSGALLVGAPFHQARGSAYLFEGGGSSWTEVALLEAPQPQPGDSFGGAVALDGPVLAIGAAGTDGAAVDGGRVYMFHRGQPGVVSAGELEASDASFDDSLGASVAASGRTFLAGAPLRDRSGSEVGVALGWDIPLARVGVNYCQGGALCPCGNPGGPGEGCVNSTGQGASLSALGSLRLAEDDLILRASGLVPGQPALLFVALNQVQGGAGAPLGDGLRCAGGSAVRLGISSADPAGSAEWGPGLAALGSWDAGDLRRFQAWYRDPTGSTCGSGLNTTPGVAVVFQP